LGLVTGGLVSAAMTGKVPADPHMALASHLNALLGCFWLVSVAFTLPYLRFGPKGARRLAWAVTLPNYANWAVTALKSFWKVSGVDAVGEVKNDTIFGLLTLLVVIPSLAAAGAWVYGFFGKPSTTSH
jgi:hydroxylaminobenzene mutase